jgi:cytochrome c oxidase subunit 2
VTPYRKAFLALAALCGGATCLQSAARAAAPEPWQLDFQAAVTPVMEEIIDFHNILLVITTLIVLFVLGLLAVVVVRFREAKNPMPSRTTHNTVIEVVWTTIPVIVLVLIAVPSFRLLKHEDIVPQADMTIKAIGHQWYWSYEYPDHGGFSFDSVMVPDSDLKPGQLRLLEVDNRIVLPVDTTVRVITTAVDVVHSWAVPAFGVKMDSVPGRANETWFKVAREGVYFGQCSELCGVNHGFMPIAVEIVSKAKFAEWVEAAKRKYAATSPEGAPSALAARTASPAP